jgi:hypothetical protein
MAITLSNREAITARLMAAVRNTAAAAGISTDMVPPIVTQNKHRSRYHRPAFGDGCGTVAAGNETRRIQQKRSPAIPSGAEVGLRSWSRRPFPLFRARRKEGSKKECPYLQESRREFAPVLAGCAYFSPFGSGERSEVPVGACAEIGLWPAAWTGFVR